MKGKEQEVVTLEKKTVFENESSDEENEDGKIGWVIIVSEMSDVRRKPVLRVSDQV